MCHVSEGMQVSQVNTRCDCVCGCPVTLPAGDEIRRREEHKKILEEGIVIIDKKIAGLKTMNGS
jgi:hypothetical protein